MAITTVIKGVQGIMRQDTGVDGDAQRISQLVWMLFLKIFDDKEQEYELEEDGIQHNFPATFRTKETADLFLLLIMTILKPRGRCGIVLPDGTLFGEGVKTRNELKKELMDALGGGC